MVATVAQREILADAWGGSGEVFSLHSADPGTTGASEIAGGSPAYARRPGVYTDAGDDGVLTTTVVFNLPAGVAVTHIGKWSSGGVFLDKAPYVVNSQATQATTTVNVTFTAS